MDVKEAIHQRRAYRSLDSVEITDEMLHELAESAQLMCSCFNNQPWRYVFVYDEDMLRRMHEALSDGNAWARSASFIITVFSSKEDDCIIKEREYYLFDTGMATGAMILRATEMGLVAHPIAGYDPVKVKEILGIPEEMMVITLVIVGRHSDTINPVLSQRQAETEKERPARKPLDEFIYHNRYHPQREKSDS